MQQPITNIIGCYLDSWCHARVALAADQIEMGSNIVTGVFIPSHILSITCPFKLTLTEKEDYIRIVGVLKY